MALVTDQGIALEVPSGLSPERRDLLTDVARRNDAVHGANLLGLILSGSAGRGVPIGPISTCM